MDLSEDLISLGVICGVFSGARVKPGQDAIPGVETYCIRLPHPFAVPHCDLYGNLWGREVDQWAG